MMEFKPQRVEPKSWRFWFKEGLSLSTRNIFSFALLALLASATHYLPGFLRGLTVLVIPLLLAFGVVLADSVDKSNRFFSRISKIPLVVWARLFAAVSMPSLLFFVLSVVLINIIPPIGDQGGDMLELMLIWFIIAGYLLWFVVPLTVIAELPLIESFYQSLEALYLNRWFFRIILAFGFTAYLFALFLPILFIPWYAMASSMMYVSFRHIWMGERDNNPVPVSSGLPIAVSK